MVIVKVFVKELLGCWLVLVVWLEKNFCIVVVYFLKFGVGVVEIFLVDVMSEDDVVVVVVVVKKWFGVVDVFINNVGVFCVVLFVEMSVKDFDEIVVVNLCSVFLMLCVFVLVMVKWGCGDVFNMSLIVGFGVYLNSVVYCVVKFGVMGFSKVMCEELCEKGVCVCCVYLGVIWLLLWFKSGVKEGCIMLVVDVVWVFFDVYWLGWWMVVEEIVLWL